MGHGLIYNNIHFNPVFWNYKKINFHSLFGCSWIIAKLNRVTKLKTEKNTVSELKICFKINVHILLHGLKWIMKKNYTNLRFSMKPMFEKSRITHKESRGYSWRKHILNKKNMYYIWNCFFVYIWEDLPWWLSHQKKWDFLALFMYILLIIQPHLKPLMISSEPIGRSKS